MSLGVPQFPAPGSQQRLDPGRKKVALKPGRSLMDWIRLGRSGKDLTGVGGRVLEVTPEELAKHNTHTDAWLSLNGKVYNVTDYMDFHPGGDDELMRGVGKDATQLFDEVHKWVNAESMLEKCYVGKMKTTSPIKKRGPGKSLSANGFAAPLAPPAPTGPPSPRYDRYQNDSSITIVIYSKWLNMRKENIIIDRNDNALSVTALIRDHTYTVHLELEHEVEDSYEVRLAPGGKVEIILQKTNRGQHWMTVGKPLDGNNSYVKTSETKTVYRSCKLITKETVSHDTQLYCFELPPSCHMCVPVGHHVHAKATIEGMEISRSYTVVIPSLSSDKQDDLVTQGKVLYLMIKIYQDGALTQYIDKLKIGECLELSNHEGDFQDSTLQPCSQLVLLAAGTGFTPMVRLLYRTLVEEVQDTRTVKLIFFNKEEKDIFWREEIDLLAEKNEKFEVVHVLSKPQESWTGPKGRIRKELLEEFIPGREEGQQFLICACGPTEFTKEAMRLCRELGHGDDALHAFLG